MTVYTLDSLAAAARKFGSSGRNPCTCGHSHHSYWGTIETVENVCMSCPCRAFQRDQ